ncbi:MAG: deoxyguanosinetriphosphate triphosphohydrolase [Oscillospiraceae bacterium]|nr:deoxyguanosinetriphosphate triphosphohydrolase [Oscillospiraceae bacterium]
MCGRERTERAEELLLLPWACKSKDSKGRKRPEGECSVRTCFQRDVDRIVHSRAFRRLKRKTQVFLQPEGDHYRTRLTHTLEVTRIARTIARNLGLNEDLTEAAALGHDLGHTPFGHAGERALNRIMPDGFSHNVQSLRVVDKLEKEGDGLNLTYEVRRGILCHTGGDKAETLEGQILWFADRIAYINHDIEDAMRGGIIYPMDIPIQLREQLGYKKSQRIDTLVRDVIETSRKEGRLCQSREVGEAMQELRSFLFAMVYHNPQAKGEEGKAEAMLHRLFEWYLKDPDQLPADFQDIRYEEGAERAVCDYIAGMTDAYAIEKYEELFIPRAWAVK